MELKHLFQGSLSLEDFHTKASRLVKQAGYEGDAKDRVLRDTIISGISSEKIRAKIVKEGHEVTLNWVMEKSKAGSFHTTTLGKDAGNCKSELCPVWKIH